MVLNWNGARALEKYLPSVVEAAAGAGAEIWVIDNNSHDDSAQVCREQFPGVRFEVMAHNKSAGSFNDAARRCDCDVVVTLDNDVVVEPDFLAPLLRHFQTPSDVFAVSSRICVYPPIERDGQLQVHDEATEVVWSEGMLRRGQTRPTDASRPIFYNCGCATARDRRRFLEIGGYDALFFPVYYDDTDLSWQAWKRGWKCLYEPASIVFHACGTSVGRSEKAMIQITRNEFLFHWKNLNAPSWVLSHLLWLAPRLLKAALTGDKARWKGFSAALRLLPLALQARREAAPHFKVGDAEVVRRINAKG